MQTTATRMSYIKILASYQHLSHSHVSYILHDILYCDYSKTLLVKRVCLSGYFLWLPRQFHVSDYINQQFYFRLLHLQCGHSWSCLFQTVVLCCSYEKSSVFQTWHMWQSGIQSYVTHILSFVCMPWILQNKYAVWILPLLPHFVIHYSLSKALQYSHSYMYQEPLVQRNRYFKASACIASVWESSTAATLVVFSWMTITWMLRSPGCKQAKAQGVSGGKLHIGFSVQWCLIDSILRDTLRQATSYIKAWTLSCHASPDIASPACLSLKFWVFLWV